MEIRRRFIIITDFLKKETKLLLKRLFIALLFISILLVINSPSKNTWAQGPDRLRVPDLSKGEKGEGEMVFVTRYVDESAPFSSAEPVIFPTLQAQEKTATFWFYPDLSVPVNAMNALNYAFDIWETQVTSTVPIEVDVTWQPLGPDILYRVGTNINFSIGNRVFASALINKLMTTNHVNGRDIVLIINKDIDWYLETDGQPGDKYDLVTTVVSAIPHGLGLFSQFTVENGEGGWGTHYSFYDGNIVNRDGQGLISNYPNPSVELGNQLQSDDLYFNGVNVLVYTGGTKPQVYAPDPWEPGGSIRNWDEVAFPPGNPDAGLTPGMTPGEVYHVPGPVTKAALLDLAWSPGSVGKPTAPSYLRVSVVNDYTVELRWDDNSDNEVWFDIYEDDQFIDASPMDSELYVRSGLTPGVEYCYKVQAYNGFGRLGFTDTVCTRTQTCTPVTAAANDPVSTSQTCTQDVNLSVVSVEPVQVLEGMDLVRGKATAIKVVISKTGPDPITDNVGVYVSNGQTGTVRFYVYAIDNPVDDNLDQYHVLEDDNTVHPLKFPGGDSEKTIYFFDDGFMPANTGLYQVTATVDQGGNITETDETDNNTTSLPRSVVDTVWKDIEHAPDPKLRILFIRTWQTDPAPLNAFREFADYSNNFLEGVLPVSEDAYDPIVADWVVPFLAICWGKCSDDEITDSMLNWYQLLKRLYTTVDRFVIVVDEGWFAEHSSTDPLRYGMYVGGMSMVEPRMKDRPNNAQVAGHEVGHGYRLPQGLKDPANCVGAPEDYNDSCNPHAQSVEIPPGSVPFIIGSHIAPGLWVMERIPMTNTTGRPVFAFMGRSKFEPGFDLEFWIDEDDYKHLLTTRTKKITVNDSPSLLVANHGIIATGVLSKTGPAVLNDWLLTEGEVEFNISELGPYSFEYQDADGVVLYQLSFSTTFAHEGMYGDWHEVDKVPFMYTIPHYSGTKKILVKHEDQVLAERVISDHAPTISVTYPNGGEQVGGEVTIQWSANDVDGDATSYLLYFSADNGVTWNPLMAGLTEASYTWDLSQVPLGQQYLVRIVTTDGFNTAEDVSDASFAVVAGTTTQPVYLPLILK